MGSVWMGDLESYMDEAFITNAFASLGESVISVKMIKNKYTGSLQGYCFVDFGNQETAERVLRKYNGKPVPDTYPTKRFKLNYAAYGHSYQSPEFSLFVGDLTPEVEDHALHEFFAQRYLSCKAAKVVLDGSGNSRGYGFVRFSTEEEQQRAQVEMDNMVGLGGKPIRVARATPKRPQHNPQSQHQQQHQQYGQYYQQYQQQYQNYYSAWGNYQQQPMPGGASHHSHSQGYYNYGHMGQYDNSSYHYQQNTKHGGSYDDGHEAVEDPDPPLDIDKLNTEFMTKSEELYEAIESSRWQPLDTVMSEIPVATKS
ncbi:tRNA selenocysteine 1-associated protein 1-like isoform X2 [Ptychodera flava]|uniref:tRNA selenocysteine 1-associated protein 1-like isoform X2 n=1 Tax=Ptychodera flava TaxID=63121 RepID=UPI003969E00D